MRDWAADMDVETELPEIAGSMLPVELRGLRFEAKGRALVDGVDLTLARRGVSVVMGANGSGKSLLLRLMNGLIPPDAGEVLYGGLPLSAETRRRLALVFQKPVLLRRSVAANLAFALRARGRRTGVEGLLARVGLTEKAHQPARLLSGGEAQRLALARALALEPAVLFLDEPTASLDPASVLAIENLVSDVAASGTKVIFVTHDIGQARRLADDIVFLHHGRVAEHRPADDFFAAPSSEAARAYLSGQIYV